MARVVGHDQEMCERPEVAPHRALWQSKQMSVHRVLNGNCVKSILQALHKREFEKKNYFNIKRKVRKRMDAQRKHLHHRGRSHRRNYAVREVQSTQRKRKVHLHMWSNSASIICRKDTL